MDTTEDAVAMTRAARELAHDRNVASIAVFTHSGRTALLMSKAKPAVTILAFTPLESTYHRMALYRGVTPYMVPFASTVESMIEIVDSAIIRSAPEQQDQQVVLISGFPVDKMRQPNFALLHTVGKSD
jgi:pyruvate kinase